MFAAESVYSWQPDVDTTVVIPALLLVYIFLAGRFGVERRQAIAAAGSLTLLAVAFWSPIHHLGLHYLLCAHLLQNVILAEWAPLLAVLALSPAMSRAAARYGIWRALTHPYVALPLWLGGYYVWHIPLVYDGALHHQSVLIHLEHAWYFGSGILFWWPLIHDEPRSLSSAKRAVYGFAAFILAAPLGLLLALLPKAIYGYYVVARPRVWGLSPLADQEIAGVTMVGEQAIVLFAVCAYWFRQFLAEEGAI